MSDDSTTFKAEIATINDIQPHPNADRLELATVYGWQCVVQKGRYRLGDKIVYIPIDSILPLQLEAAIFGPDSKVKLNKHRIKTIKLRGAISQGLVADLEVCGLKTTLAPGTDVTKKLGITKYEPPAPKFQSQMGAFGRKTKHHHENPYFKKYTKFNNYKYYIDLFEPEEEVIITEKIHGTNFRAGWVPFHANTLWRKLLKLLGLAPKWTFVYGSHNVQISEKPTYKGFYEKNVYAETVVKYDLENIIPKGLVVYGEIYGAGIQKNYNYGLKEDRALTVFDIMDSETSEYLNRHDFEGWTKSMELPTPPTLHKGRFGKCSIEKLIDGPSVLAPEQKIREGIVIKTIEETKSIVGRKALKAINPEYLLKDNTEYH